MQKCNALIFNLLRNLSLRFLQKRAKKPCFDGLFWSESRVFFVYWILLLSGKRV